MHLRPPNTVATLCLELETPRFNFTSYDTRMQGEIVSAACNSRCAAGSESKTGMLPTAERETKWWTRNLPATSLQVKNKKFRSYSGERRVTKPISDTHTIQRDKANPPTARRLTFIFLCRHKQQFRIPAWSFFAPSMEQVRMSAWTERVRVTVVNLYILHGTTLGGTSTDIRLVD